MVWTGTWPATDPAARRLDDGALRVVFAAAAAAASWFVVASATGMVRQFGGHIAFLGSALPYATSAPALIAWGLVLTAALAVASLARTGHGAPGLRLGLRALVAGALCEVVSAGLSLWVSGLSSHFGSLLANVDEIVALLRASDALIFVSLVAFAIGALAARTTWPAALDAGDVDEPATEDAAGLWRRALRLLAVALSLGAVAQGYDVVGSLLSSPPPARLTFVMVELMTTALWVGIAASLVLVGRALGLDERVRRFAVASSVGATGATLLAVASLAQFVYFEVQDTSPAATWIDQLAKLSTASECLAWLAVMVAFGCAAVATTTRRSPDSLHPRLP